ncbi:hypothetical protein [Virgibacillus sp. SK37]|uniref:hypothetical protein n=1 Tax=Virgibacillus sp. SK37 TaxID=403957 RepID=UPI0004D1EB4B|nr:hypothetical protein [Virgibacillus sp. SK37]AIF45657.1 hypothetical protein X953_18890 [Virgibacillus sp. SK37]
MSDNFVRVVFGDGEEVSVTFEPPESIRHRLDVFYNDNAIRWVSSEEIENIRNDAPLPIPNGSSTIPPGDWINGGYYTSIHGSFKPYVEEVKLADNKYRMTRYLKEYYNHLVKLNKEGINFDYEEIELVFCFMQDYVYYGEELTENQIKRINSKYNNWKDIRHLENLV